MELRGEIGTVCEYNMNGMESEHVSEFEYLVFVLYEYKQMK